MNFEHLRESFYEEAGEHLAVMEAGLLQLEAGGVDPELLHTVFRAAHSIKGGGASFGFVAIAGFTHVVESVLDRMRDGALDPSPARIRVLLAAADRLRDLVEATRRGEAESIELGSLEGELFSVLDLVGGMPTGSGRSVAERSADPTTWRVEFEPGAEFFLQGQDIGLLLRDLGALGEVTRVECDCSRLPALAALDPEACHLRWTVRLSSRASETEIRDVFLFVEEACVLHVVNEGEEAGEETRVDAVAPESTAMAPAPTASAKRSAPRGSLADAPAIGPSVDRRATPRAERAAESGPSSIRVSTERVDALIDLVGELVIAQAMVQQAASGVDGEALERLHEALDVVQRSTREVQERVMGIRMLPIGIVFQRLPRLVHDVAATLGRRARLEIAGSEIELDKSMIERLSDPLTHLVRNSVDHGIEPSDERVRLGKDAEGIVSIRVSHEGGNILLEIEDDGRGLNRARIREKCVALGLAPATAAADDPMWDALIFEPGVSTSAQVSDVSGRGVGMDVVRRNVEALNGSISVASTPGVGTRFRIRLPLTLAILDGLSVRVGREVYVVPLLSIVQSLRPSPGDVMHVLGARGEILVLRGEPLPLLRLASRFGVPDATLVPEDAIALVLESDGRRFAVLVDEVLGQAQVVIKSLEANYRRVDAVMGATILGDGRVSFILDVPELYRTIAFGARGVGHAACADDSATETGGASFAARAA